MNHFKTGSPKSQKYAKLWRFLFTAAAALLLTPSAQAQSCSEVGKEAFIGCYYNNDDFTGSQVARVDRQINFNWGENQPIAGIDADTFSVRWQGTFTFSTSGYYEFRATADDGVRLYLNNRLILDGWREQAATEYRVLKFINAGKHLIRVEYFDRYEDAEVRLAWVRREPIPTPAPTPRPTPTPAPTPNPTPAPPPPPSAGGILFRMNYAANAFPLAGWEYAAGASDGLGSDWTRAHRPGIGPFGQNAVELRELPSGEHRQHDWGWSGDAGPAFTQGTARYFRWRARLTPDSNCNAIGGTGGGADSSNKLLIIAQGCPGGQCRVILNVKCRRGSGLVQYNVAIDGGSHQTETDFVYPRGQWHNVQLEVRGGSTTNNPNGGWRLWVNSNTTPALVRSGIVLHTGESYTIFGGYNNNGLAQGGIHTWQYTDFEVGTSFDPNWHR